MDELPEDELSRWCSDAAEARRRGDYLGAAILYAKAAAATSTAESRLQLRLREAFCHTAMGHVDESEAIAVAVAEEARSEGFYAELADALGVLVDHRMASDRFAEASELLAEAMYVMEQVPNDPAHHQVVHNMAVTYQRCEFPQAALELYDRALRLAANDEDRTLTYANITAAHHMAMINETDPAAAAQHAHDGIYAATAALDPHAASEVLARVVALAHRAVLFNAIGQHAAALDDARAARQLAEQHNLREERVVALIADGVARWRLYHDVAALEVLRDAARGAQELGIDMYLKSATPVMVDILWDQARYGEARTLLVQQRDDLVKALVQERATRLEYVRLGISHKSTQAISESDPLTGLPNRRFLGTFLPEVLDAHGPVCVAMLDLDGFKQINDRFSYAHGDRVLLELSGILQRICRRGDAVIRFGGDEFVIVLRETSPGDARQVLERVRQLIATRAWDGLPATVTLTASVGVAVGSGALDGARVLAAAGEALHCAKREGRDRIVFS